MYSVPPSHHRSFMKTVSYADITDKHSLLQRSHKFLQKVVPLFLEPHLFHVDVTRWHSFIAPLDTVILAGKPHIRFKLIRVPRKHLSCAHSTISRPQYKFVS